MTTLMTNMSWAPIHPAQSLSLVAWGEDANYNYDLRERALAALLVLDYTDSESLHGAHDHIFRCMIDLCTHMYQDDGENYDEVITKVIDDRRTYAMLSCLFPEDRKHLHHKWRSLEPAITVTIMEAEGQTNG